MPIYAKIKPRDEHLQLQLVRAKQDRYLVVDLCTRQCLLKYTTNGKEDFSWVNAYYLNFELE